MRNLSSDKETRSPKPAGDLRFMPGLRERAIRHTKLLIWIVTIVGSVGSVLAGLVSYWDLYRKASDAISGPSVTSNSKAIFSKKLPWLSVAIAPFDDLSNSKDTLASSLTETLVTEISRFSGFVVRRVPIEDKAKAPSELEGKLGVRYLLRGNVGRSGDLVRVNAQLVDMETSVNIWTDKVEGDGKNQFELLDLIAARLANALNLEMVKAASARLLSEKLPNPDAEDYALMGRNILRTKLRTRSNLREAQSLLQKSLEMKPDNLDTLVALSVALSFEAISFPDSANEAKAARSDELADKALRLAPASADAHVAKSLILVYYGRIPESGEQAELAANINPNLSQAHVLIASAKFRLSKFQEAIDAGKRSLRIDPSDQQVLLGFLHIGNSYVALKDYDNAVLWLQRMVASNAAIWRGHAGLASAFALQNQMKMARMEIAETKKLNPAFSVSYYRNFLHVEGEAANEFLDRVSAALRDAEAPEISSPI